MWLRLRHVWICGLAMAIGCQQQSDTAQPGEFGRFEGEVVASWDDNGRHMTLREGFAYVDPQNRRWVAPAGTVVDGASIPRGFWTVIGGPFEGRYRNASVVHDIGCDEMRESWEDVHRMFYDACRCGGVDETQAKMMYYAVYHFGPRWERVTETQLEWQPGDDGQMVQRPVTIETAVRIDPPAPTPEEIEQVVEFIAEDNPTVTSIKQMDREALHRRPRRGRNKPSGLSDLSGRRGPERTGEGSSAADPARQGEVPARQRQRVSQELGTTHSSELTVERGWDEVPRNQLREPEVQASDGQFNARRGRRGEDRR